MDDQKQNKKKSGFGMLGDPDRLYALARSRDAGARTELGETITGLFVNTNLTVREQEVVSDILIALLRQAETEVRSAISERLSVLRNAPLRVILHLSNDEIDVARAVLERSPVLEEMDLLLIIEMQREAYWQAIANRIDIKESVIQALVDTNDPGTSVNLVKNTNIVIPPDSFRKLIERAETIQELGAPLLSREDIPNELKAALYAASTHRIERQLDRENAGVDGRMGVIASDVASEFINASTQSYVPTEMMIEAAHILKKRRQLTIDTMMTALKNGQIASFMAQVMVFSDINLSSVQRMVGAADGEMLAAFCRTNRLEKKIFLKMFLLTEKYRTGGRIIEPLILNQALSNHDRLTLDACEQIMVSLREG